MDDGTPGDELQRARERVHLLEAVVMVMKQPHHLLDVVLESADVADAAKRLEPEFDLTDSQASLVLDMQFRRMSHLERQRVATELVETRAAIDDLGR